MAQLTSVIIEVDKTFQAAQGTITADTKAWNSAATWNNAAVTFTHMKANVTDTASAAASMFLDFQLDSVSKLSVGKTGAIAAAHSVDGDYAHSITNANAGTAAEANLYVRNAAAANAGVAVGVAGTGYTTAGGFVQDAGWVSAGSALSGGLSLIARGGTLRVYANGHTNLCATFSSTENQSHINTQFTAGVVIGSPTGGYKGTGTLNAAADIYKNNSAYTNPHYAFEHWATGRIELFRDRDGAQDYPGRMALDELETYVRHQFHFPRITDEPMGAFQRGDVALELIEEAFTHLFDLNRRLKTLEG